MPRSFLRHATRWILTGIIGMSAIGGVPAIAAACEGGGEEVGQLSTNGKFRNPFELEAEIVAIVRDPGTGPILGGTCKVDSHYGSLVGCEVEQDPTLGAIVTWRRL